MVHTGPDAEIETLTVLPAHRGKESAALVKAVLPDAEQIGVGHLGLGVIASNRTRSAFMSVWAYSFPRHLHRSGTAVV